MSVVLNLCIQIIVPNLLSSGVFLIPALELTGDETDTAPNWLTNVCIYLYDIDYIQVF